MNQRTVFIISDRTGITAETMTRSLLSQFPGLHFEMVALPFVDTNDKAHDAARQISEAAERDGAPPLVFTTLVDEPVRDAVAEGNGIMFHFFDAFLGPLESVLGMASTHSVGKSHGVTDRVRYTSRISAVSYSVRTDDGVNPNDYDRASLVIIGVSRSGKTPTSIYLALQFGLYAANYPLTDGDLETGELPPTLVPHRRKLFGLTIDPERLAQIRTERRPNSRYAELKRCREEVRNAEALFRLYSIPFVDTTQMSIEEIATTIIQRAHLRREHY